MEETVPSDIFCALKIIIVLVEIRLFTSLLYDGLATIFCSSCFEDVDRTWETFEKTLWGHIANFLKLAKERYACILVSLLHPFVLFYIFVYIFGQVSTKLNVPDSLT